jgi:hypothetical protein
MVQDLFIAGIVFKNIREKGFRKNEKFLIYLFFHKNLFLFFLLKKYKNVLV